MINSMKVDGSDYYIYNNVYILVCFAVRKDLLWQRIDETQKTEFL